MTRGIINDKALKTTPWTTNEETFIRRWAGILDTKEIAERLNRSYGSVKNHAYLMRKEGRLKTPSMTVQEVPFTSWLVECPECYRLRTKLTNKGICLVCTKQKQLEQHKKKMYQIWVNLPQELKDASRGCEDVSRGINLMKHETRLSYPKPPDVAGLPKFNADMAIDNWFKEVEKYELRILTLDIDAVKQRCSKWRKKAKKYEKNNDISDHPKMSNYYRTEK